MFPKFKEILNSAFSYKKSLERENVSQESVNLLREKIKDLKIVPKSLTDKQLLRFLFVYKDDLDKVVQLMEKYYDSKATLIEFFKNRDVLSEDIQKCLENQYFIFLPIMNGNKLLVFYSLRNFDHKTYDYDASSKVYYMLIEAYTYYYGPFSEGVFLYSMKGSNIRFLFRPKFSSMRKSSKFLEEAVPIYIEKMIVLDTISPFDMYLSLIKQLTTKSENLERIHFYNSNMNFEKFYETQIPKSHLPKEFGGTLGSLEELHQETKKLLLNMRDYFILEEKQTNFEFDDYIKEHPDEVHHSD